MAIFNRFPYTNGHELNLDWVLKMVKKLPTKVSQLINDAGYLTMDTVPVKSVNGKTGDVDLNYQDVNALPGDLPIALGTHNSGSALRFNMVDINVASGNYSVAEGYRCTASGSGSHVEGRNNVASGRCAHVEGEECVGDHLYHHVFGCFNAQDPNTSAAITEKGQYIEMVGNGTSTTARSNARTLDWDGNEILAGKLTMGADPYDPMDAASKKYVDRSVIGYGVTDAASTSTDFTATIPGITELNNSTIILIKNTAVTSANGCTLNVNNLGAKPIYNNMGNTSVTTLFKVNYTFLMLYDSSLDTDGAWIMYLGYYQNDNTIGYQIRSQTTQTMLGVLGRYRLIFQSADNKHYVAANQSTSASASAAKDVTTTPINPFGTIQYYSNSGSIANGNKPSASYVWKQYICDSIGYSFSPSRNVPALVVGEPVYLKCTPQTAGSAIIDPTTPIVTDLPTTEDGSIYIMLGIGNTTTKLELQINHPVYQYKNGKICLYTGN